jgi:hypothetical protein
MSNFLDRLIESLLPNGGILLVLYEAYLDESGCDDYSRVLAVGGYVIHSERARVMERLWRETLEKYGLPYFHMVDCAHGNGVFDRFEIQERVEIQKAFMAIIESHAQYGMATVTPTGRYEGAGRAPSDPYAWCLTCCAGYMSAAIIDNAPKGSRLLLFFEAGHASATAAREFMGKFSRRSEIISGYSFAKKTDLCLLQAADLFVWHCAKRTKDQAYGSRPPRKDFLKLVEKNATIVYTFIYKGRGMHVLNRDPHKDDPIMQRRVREMFNDVPFTDPALKSYFEKDLAEVPPLSIWHDSSSKD